MKLLSFQAEYFSWEPFSQTIEDADDGVAGVENDVAVFWLHIEKKDAFNHSRTLKYACKHIKWVANKRKLQNIVLHSFSHLGGDTAEATYARTVLRDISMKLKDKYNVQTTPFGWFCSWNIKVYGDSMAKVFKEF